MHCYTLDKHDLRVKYTVIIHVTYDLDIRNIYELEWY